MGPRQANSRQHGLEGVSIGRGAERRRQTCQQLRRVTHPVAGDQPPAAVELVAGVCGKGIGEARLADPAWPDNRDDGAGRHRAAQRRQFVLAAEQRSLHTVVRRSLWLGADDREMQVNRLPVGRDAEFGRQRAPAVLVGTQRCRAMSRRGERGDQLAMRLLTERVVVDCPTSEVDGLAEATEGAARRGRHLQGAVPCPLDTRAIPRDPFGVEIRQQRARETIERLGGELDRCIGIAIEERRVGLVGEADGGVYVDGAACGEAVSARGRLDDAVAASPDRAESLSQLGDDVAQRLLPVGRRCLPPHHVCQSIHRHRGGRQRQGGDEAAGERSLDRRAPNLIGDGDLAEQADLHTSILAVASTVGRRVLGKRVSPQRACTLTQTARTVVRG